MEWPQSTFIMYISANPFSIGLKIKTCILDLFNNQYIKILKIDHLIPFSFFFEKPGISRSKSFTFNENLNIDHYFNFQILIPSENLKIEC